MSDELHQPATEDGPDWAAYYRHTLGREPRPLFVKGMAALQAAGITAGDAVEIGFGDGTETMALLEAGWRVVAVDAAPDAAEVLRGRVDGARADRLEIRTESAETASLPPFDLLYAGYALSFIPPAAFRRFWRRVRAQLRPGGFLVVNIFGVRDTWAGEPGKTFVARDEVFRMLQGLEVVSLDEEDQDGDSFTGPKHWHVFDIVARRPLAVPA
ncbi:MAG TPA: class I SAM-dependent methyltransferase [Candidatus Limnocylindrales bacterium]|nr:class I SAM-dependent methyltransferase [Candidatus Limnocylindrales bacterium]